MAAKDLSEYEEGESVWKKEEIEGVIYIQLKKPGYACNPQEFVENKIFVSCMQIDSRHTLMDFRLIISIAKNEQCLLIRSLYQRTDPFSMFYLKPYFYTPYSRWKVWQRIWWSLKR